MSTHGNTLGTLTISSFTTSPLLPPEVSGKLYLFEKNKAK
jgi:hypothetical protein